MFDTVLILQTHYAELNVQLKQTANEKRRAAIDCKMQNIRKAINALVLINNNPVAFKQWADAQIKEIEQINESLDNAPLSSLLKPQAT